MKQQQKQQSKSQSQNDQQKQLIQFLQAIAQVTQVAPKTILQIAQSNPQVLEQAVTLFQQSNGDWNQAAAPFMEAIKQMTQSAAHGAKLNYVRKITNRCADDEETYFYKVGGKIGCGCKKKEQGGRVQETGKSVLERFKEKCGGKMKKHKQGGSLNGIPFYQNGGKGKPERRGKTSRDSRTGRIIMWNGNEWIQGDSEEAKEISRQIREQATYNKKFKVDVDDYFTGEPENLTTQYHWPYEYYVSPYSSDQRLYENDDPAFYYTRFHWPGGQPAKYALISDIGTRSPITAADSLRLDSLRAPIDTVRIDTPITTIDSLQLDSLKTPIDTARVDTARVDTSKIPRSLIAAGDSLKTARDSTTLRPDSIAPTDSLAVRRDSISAKRDSLSTDSLTNSPNIEPISQKNDEDYLTLKSKAKKAYDDAMALKWVPSKSSSKNRETSSKTTTSRSNKTTQNNSSNKTSQVSRNNSASNSKNSQYWKKTYNDWNNKLSYKEMKALDNLGIDFSNGTKKLQSELNRIFSNKLEEDGKLGPKTLARIKEAINLGSMVGSKE